MFFAICCFITVFGSTSLYSRTDYQFCKEIFTYLATENMNTHKTASGAGSTLTQTAKVRTQIPLILRQFDITSVLDAGCGDLSWAAKIDFSSLHYYAGIDIVEQLIEQNQQHYGSSTSVFFEGNIITDPLPKADLIICRDCFVHFSFDDIKRALKNFKNSGARYLLTTTFFSENRNNFDIKTGQWRPLNMQLSPFNFPNPEFVIHEECTQHPGYLDDKALALWKLEDIIIAD